MVISTDDVITTKNALLLALQWLCVNLITCIVFPVVVAPYLGLDQEGLRLLTQRTFFLSGLATLMQIYLGHKMPIFEGPSAIWISAIIALNSSAILSAKPLSQLQSELALAFIISGTIYIIIACFKLMVYVTSLFTPAVMGTFFILIFFQIGNSFIGSYIKLHSGTISLNWSNITVALITIIAYCFLSFYGSAKVKTFSLLGGALAGWVFNISASLISLIPMKNLNISRLDLIEPPSFLPWGVPQFNISVIATSIVVSFVIFANLIATVKGMADQIDMKTPDMDRAVMITGTANIMGGLGGTIGFVSQSHCIGFVSVTGNDSKLPVAVHAIIFMVMGLFPIVGALFASMPIAAGQAIMMVILFKMLSMGISHYATFKRSKQTYFVIGLPLLIGILVIFFPDHYFSTLPVIISGIAGNGLVIGLLSAILLNNFIKPLSN